MNSKNSEDDKSNLEVKYRPTSLYELVGQPQFVNKASNWIMTRDIPHLLFFGPPGVGKTSAAEVLACELFGEDNWEQSFKRHSAADFCGIATVRGPISSEMGNASLYTKYKIIFLDEVDSMTVNAQEALKTKMETYTGNAKFILACNKKEKIIEAIRNRCAEIPFNLIEENEIVKRLKYICENENITYDHNALEKIAKISNGILRKAIINLTVYKDSYNHINVEDIEEDMKTLELMDIENLLNKVFEGNIQEYDKILLQLYGTGEFDANEILNQFFETIKNDKKYNEVLKHDLFEQIGIYKSRIDQGNDELLQMRCFLSALRRCHLNFSRV
jgi:replication factor C small subunit